MPDESILKGLCTALLDLMCHSVMDLFRGHERNARVAMLVVVPVKERLAERSCVVDGAKPFGELGTIFQGLELCFRERVVIALIGPAVGFGDPEVGKQVGNDFGLHARSPISMNGELSWLDAVLQ